MKVALIAFLLALRCHGAVDERFLNALVKVESPDGRPGDNGKAIGPYQFHRAAWDQANALRVIELRTIGQKSIPFPYQKAKDGKISRLMAQYYLRWLEARLYVALGRWPSNSEEYAAWNLGFDGFERRRFRLKSCPAVTQRAAKKLEGLLR